MKILITTGPASVPIDDMRVLTNMSSGRTGTALSHYFKQRGHDVICLRGKQSTAELPPKGVHVQEFKDNAQLLEQLKDLSIRYSPDAILHAAALSDFILDYVTDSKGNCIQGHKIPSRAGNIHLILKPAPKILPQLRTLWPDSIIVGWKYELDGTHESAIAAAIEQVRESKSNFAVANGSAYGRGFGICDGNKHLDHCVDLLVLAQRLQHHILQNK